MSFAARAIPPTAADVKRAALAALAAELDRAVRRAAPAIARACGELTALAVRNAPEAASLQGGRLQGELGPVDPRPVIDEVCRAISQNVVYRVQGVRVSGDGIEGGLSLHLLSQGLAELRDAFDRAAFTSENGHVVDWLRWLLLRGHEVVVSDHTYKAGYNRDSRTGLGLMRKGGAWSVPAEFAGTEGSNWLVRVALTTEAALTLAVVRELGASV